MNKVKDMPVKGEEVVEKKAKKSVSYALKVIQSHLDTIHVHGGLLTKEEYHGIKDKLVEASKTYVKQTYGF